jgi:GNAT superfamily N-acetyltransferase
MPPDLDLAAASAFPLVELAGLFGRAFEDYVVEVRVTAEALAARARVESIDLAASRVAVRGGEPVAVALVARRGWTCRVAAMGVVKPARRTGAGRFVLGRVLDEARARGERRVVLEVVESNRAAVRLYQEAGFRAVRRLVGWRAAIAPGPAPPTPTPCDPVEVARRVASLGPDDGIGADGLPWQVAPTSLAQVAPPAAAWSLDGRAFALVSGVTDEVVVLGALVTDPAHRRRGHARRLLGGLAALHPGRALAFTPILPDDLAAAFFARTGFERRPLTQLEMARRL